MKITGSNPKSVDKHRSTSEHPYYFGAFLNLARHNAYLVLNHISERVVPDRYTDQDENLLHQHKMVSELNKPGAMPIELSARIKQNISYFMPWYNSLSNWRDENNDELPCDIILKSFLHSLSDIRNIYTHYLPAEKNISLTGEQCKWLDILFKAAKDGLQNRFPELRGKTEFLEPSSESDKPFYHNLYNKDTNVLTQNGLIFFTSLFLERKYVFQFTAECIGFKYRDGAKYRATTECYAFHGIRLPNIKIKSEDTKMALALDILNELQRCPSELFGVLSRADKQKFLTMADDASDEEITPAEGINTLKRYEDRTPYFIMRFFDEVKAFDRLRFQLRLGRWITKDPYKKSIGGAVVNRTLFKEVHIFHRLQDVLNLNSKSNAPLEYRPNDSGTMSSSWDQWAPAYNMDNNKIGILLSEKNTTFPWQIIRKETQIERNTDVWRIQNQKPTAHLSVHSLPFMAFLFILHNNDANIPNPESVIQTYVQNLKQFFSDLKSGTLIWPLPEPVSRYMNTEIKRKDISPEDRGAYEYSKVRLGIYVKEHYGLKLDFIPKKITDRLLNIFDIGVMEKVKLFLSDYTEKLDMRIKSCDQQRHLPKTGEIATYIARNIIQWCPEGKSKQKITSAYYDRLQYMIAYFPLHKEEIITILNELSLFKGQEAKQPFLHKDILTRSTNVVEFYHEYLKTEKKFALTHLERVNKSIYSSPKMNKDVLYSVIPILPASIVKETKERSREWTTITTGYESLETIELPKEIFDEPILDALGVQSNDQGKRFVSKEIGVYYENKSQKYYDLKRKYTYQSIAIEGTAETVQKKSMNIQNELTFIDGFKNIKKKLLFKKAQDPKNYIGVDTTSLGFEERKKNIANKLIKEILNTEKTIRFCKLKDRILLNMATYILKATEGSNVQNLSAFDIQRIVPFDSTSPLRQTMELKVPIYGKLIVNPKIQIRRYNDLKRLQRDRRLEHLVQYFSENEILQNRIEKELIVYEKERVLVLESCYFLEKAIHEGKMTEPYRIYSEAKARESKLTVEEGYHNFKNHIDFLISLEVISNEEGAIIALLRNKFAHNQTPEKAEIQVLLDQNNNLMTYCGLLGEYVRTKTNNIIASI